MTCIKLKPTVASWHQATAYYGILESGHNLLWHPGIRPQPTLTSWHQAKPHTSKHLLGGNSAHINVQFPESFNPLGVRLNVT